MPAALELITEHPNAYGRALAVAPDGATWATCDGLRVKVMDAAGDRIAEQASPGESLFGLAFARDGKTLFAAPRALDVTTGEWRSTADPGEAVAAELGPAALSGFSVHDAAVSPAGLLVVRAEFRSPRGPGSSEPFTGATQRVLALDAGTLARRALLWEGSGVPIGALAAGAGLAAAGLGELCVWREDGSPVASLTGHGPAAVTALAFSADGELLASGDAEGMIALWPLPDGGPVTQILDAHAGHVRAVAFHPDELRLASCGEDGRIAVWALSGELLAEADAGGAVEAIALAPSGDRLLASCARPDPFVRVYAL